MLEVKNISYKIGDRVILDNISFNANTNKILAILGPNGAGKSTLLNIFSGLLKPNSGRIIYNGQNINRFDTISLSRIRAVVAQKTNLNVPFSVLDVILMGRTPHQSSPENNIEIAIKSAELTSITHLLERPYTNLSGGEQQRVHIARALAQVAFETSKDKKFLLLDEHTSNLDIGQSYNLMKVCKDFKNENLGVIWIVHDINLALDFADEFLFLKKGQVVAHGDKKVINEQMISSLYDLELKSNINSDRLNFIPQI